MSLSDSNFKWYVSFEQITLKMYTVYQMEINKKNYTIPDDTPPSIFKLFQQIKEKYQFDQQRLTRSWLFASVVPIFRYQITIDSRCIYNLLHFRQLLRILCHF